MCMLVRMRAVSIESLEYINSIKSDCTDNIRTLSSSIHALCVNEQNFNERLYSKFNC